jgi:uncharacterized membrane protein
MAIDVTTQIVIDRPRQEVAAYAADPTHAPEWYENIESVVWKTDPPVRIGSKMDFVAHMMGRRLAYTYEVTELIPGEKLVMRTAQGPFPMETTYTWESAGEGKTGSSTLMKLRNRGMPSGFAKVGSRLMAAVVRRETNKNLKALKVLLEARR